MFIERSLSDKRGNAPTSDLVAIPVWDLPIRGVHWAIALLVPLSWLTAKMGWFVWHRGAGYALSGLLIFRVYWGIFGSQTARFADFVRSPAALLRYARTLRGGHRAAVMIGHNPLGGWSVMALLLALALEVGLGLFAVGVDGTEFGPLSAHVSFHAGRQMAVLHEGVFNMLLCLIGLHILAVLFHLFVKNDNLIEPMITGIRRVPSTEVHTIHFASLRAALVGVVASILIVLFFLFLVEL